MIIGVAKRAKRSCNHLLQKEKRTARHAACVNRTGSSCFQWWRRRESNPRPKIIHTGLYMLIPDFDFTCTIPSRQGVVQVSLLAISLLSEQATDISYPVSRRPFRTHRKNPEGRWPKRPERSYNRLRLCLSPAFFTG